MTEYLQGNKLNNDFPCVIIMDYYPAIVEPFTSYLRNVREGFHMLIFISENGNIVFKDGEPNQYA